MTSFELTKKFWKVNEQEVVNTSTVAVYLFLLEIWNRNNHSLEFSISDKEITNRLKMSRNTLRTSREKLRDLKLLQYKRKIGHSFVYNIVSDRDDLSSTSKQIIPPPIENKFSEKENVTVQKTPKVEKPKPVQTIVTEKPKQQINIPTENEFLAFAKSLEIYDQNSPNIDFKIKAKYESWVNNGWKNGHNKPIRNWKTNLKSTLPYLLTPNNSFTAKVPVIKRPKQTYNE